MSAAASREWTFRHHLANDKKLVTGLILTRPHVVKEKQMKKQAGLTRFELMVLLVSGILTFSIAVLAAYSALVHWQVH